MSRILLVEDEDVLRRTLERFLSRNNRSVLSVSQRVQALTLIDSGSFDLLVTDLVLPDGSGAQLVDHARSRGMEVIVITAYGTPDLQARLAAQGVPCLAKPFDLSLLEATVEAAGRKGRRQT